MKKVKMILAVAAVMFAVAGTLATATNASKKSLLLVNVAERGQSCTLVGTCTNVGDIDCKQQISPGVFRFFNIRESATSCPNPAKGDFSLE